MDFHRHNVMPYSYLRVKSSGGVLEISPDHLLLAHMPVSFMRAAVLRPGDNLFVASDAGILVPRSITSIEQLVGKGLYAPLSFSGYLLVNGVAVSSYALFWNQDIIQEMETYPTAHQMIVHSHHIMQLMALPLRWGLSSALWMGCMDWLGWTHSERFELHCAFNGKILFASLASKLAC